MAEIKQWIVTGTSMVVEAETAEEAVERADQMSGWHWEARPADDILLGPAGPTIKRLFTFLVDIPEDGDWDADVVREEIGNGNADMYNDESIDQSLFDEEEN